MESENDRWDWMDCHLTQYNEILQELKGRASVIPAGIKLEYLIQVQQLEQRQKKFKVKYKKFQEVSDEERIKMQDALEKAWKELELTFDNVIKKYK
jgi:aspartate ammonia-lyase